MPGGGGGHDGGVDRGRTDGGQQVVVTGLAADEGLGDVERGLRAGCDGAAAQGDHGVSEILLGVEGHARSVDGHAGDAGVAADPVGGTCGEGGEGGADAREVGAEAYQRDHDVGGVGARAVGTLRWGAVDGVGAADRGDDDGEAREEVGDLDEGGGGEGSGGGVFIGLDVARGREALDELGDRGARDSACGRRGRAVVAGFAVGCEAVLGEEGSERPITCGAKLGERCVASKTVGVC